VFDESGECRWRDSEGFAAASHSRAGEPLKHHAAKILGSKGEWR
jgi:hypothetical protein